MSTYWACEAGASQVEVWMYVDAVKVVEQTQERSRNGGLLGRRETRERWVELHNEIRWILTV